MKKGKESDRPVHRTPDGRSPHVGPVHHVSREQVSWLRCFHQPKAYRGNWSSAGCHTIFSTKLMREKGGFDAMIKVCEAFDKVALLRPVPRVQRGRHGNLA